MDLGIAGKWALVCAASKGLGKGCAKALVQEGVNVVVTARTSPPPSARNSAAVASSASAPRAVTTTFTPSRTSAAAQPFPRPLLAAQTSAHLPAMPRSMRMSFRRVGDRRMRRLSGGA